MIPKQTTKALSKNKFAKIHYTIWMTEYFARKSGIKAVDTNAIFRKKRITEWLMQNYESLHSVPPGYVYEEIKDRIYGTQENTR